jgi:hypothetical protein
MFDHKNLATGGLYPGRVTHRSVANLGTFEFDVSITEIPITGTESNFVTGSVASSSLLNRLITGIFGTGSSGDITGSSATSINVSGNTTAGEVGSVGYSGTGDVTLPLSSNLARGFVGTTVAYGGDLIEVPGFGGGGYGFNFGSDSYKYKVKIRITRNGKTWEYESEVGSTMAKVIAKVMKTKIAEPSVSYTGISMAESREPQIKVTTKH